jgi:hypothetical protein
MELITKKRLHLVAGRNNKALAEEVAVRLGEQLGPVSLASFRQRRTPLQVRRIDPWSRRLHLPGPLHHQ